MSTKLANVVKTYYKKLRGFFPSAIPTGMEAFNAWADELENTYWLPTADKDSIRFALASIIMHLGPQSAFRSKWYFALTLRAGAAKQVAGAFFYEIKQKQQLAAKNQPTEVTGTIAGTSNAPKPVQN